MNDSSKTLPTTVTVQFDTLASGHIKTALSYSPLLSTILASRQLANNMPTTYLLLCVTYTLSQLIGPAVNTLDSHSNATTMPVHVIPPCPTTLPQLYSFQHQKPNTPEHSPHRWMAINYDSKVHLTPLAAATMPALDTQQPSSEFNKLLAH
jgi:hypothetical protein